MKNVTSALSGLASSLLFSAGFETLAQKLDPVFASAAGAGDPRGPSFTFPCSFAPKPGV